MQFNVMPRTQREGGREGGWEMQRTFRCKLSNDDDLNLYTVRLILKKSRCNRACCGSWVKH